MAARARPAPTFRLSADAIRDVCARPAVVAALAESLPTAATSCAADRRRAVADGVARALEAALGDGERDAALLDEAEQRMWEPVPAELARLLHRAGPEGLFAYFAVEGAARREAWRADARRRHGERALPLSDDAPTPPERDPIDLRRFRLDVERSLAETARRTGLSEDLAYGVLVDEISYVEAGRRSGRSPNALWMALARVRPDWRGVAKRGREAGLGGGVLVRVADRTDAAVRRAIRWRLVGGTAALVLLGASLAGVLAASRLDPGAQPRPAEPVEEVAPSPGEGPYGQVGRILALEAARRLAAYATAPVRSRSGTERPSAGAAAGATASAGASASAQQGAQAPTAPAASHGGAPSCGLGTAALACR